MQLNLIISFLAALMAITVLLPEQINGTAISSQTHNMWTTLERTGVAKCPKPCSEGLDGSCACSRLPTDVDGRPIREDCPDEQNYYLDDNGKCVPY